MAFCIPPASSGGAVSAMPCRSAGAWRTRWHLWLYTWRSKRSFLPRRRYLAAGCKMCIWSHAGRPTSLRVRTICETRRREEQSRHVGNRKQKGRNGKRGPLDFCFHSLLPAFPPSLLPPPFGPRPSPPCASSPPECRHCLRKTSCQRRGSAIYSPREHNQGQQLPARPALTSDLRKAASSRANDKRVPKLRRSCRCVNSED